MTTEHSERVVSKIRDFAAKGMSARGISDELAAGGIRLTRNAVIGITHRRGIRLGRIPVAQKAPETKVGWDDVQDAILRDGWLNGLTDNAISARILEETGVYRSKAAVHGRSTKLRLPKKSAALQAKSKKAAEPKPSRITRAFPADREPIEAPAGGVALLDIGPDQCRWVIAPGRQALMCGAGVTAPGSAWCATHRAIVYVPAAKRVVEIRRLNATALAVYQNGPKNQLLPAAF